MRIAARSAIAFSAAALCLAGAPRAQSGGLMPIGPGSSLADAGACVTTQQWASVQLQVTQYARTNGFLATPQSLSQKLAFFPLGGRPGEDIFAWYYADLDPSVGIRDFSCGPFTYDGHDATDAVIRSFAEQDIGMPIFAAMDGRVIATDDGHPDRNTAGNLQPNNYVVIDHGNGRLCYYWHMRKDSVAVQPKQFVRAGQQIGMCGSSGHSSYPHLHFAVHDAGRMLEPHVGACNTTTNGWLWQPAWQESFQVLDCGITRTDPSTVPPYPERAPVGGQLALGDPSFYFWAEVLNHLPNGTWRARFKRPDTTTAYESPVTPFSPAYYFRWWVWYWRFDVPELHTLPGTWTFELEVNGAKVVAAPFTVRTTYDAGFNRPPEAIGATLDPIAPAATEAVSCKVSASQLLDDLDYDLVRFRYEWRVNGGLVRDVTIAAHSDMLAAGMFQTGDQIQCRVTPNDGKVNGPSATVSTTATPPLWIDLGANKVGAAGPPLLMAAGVLLEKERCQWLLEQCVPNTAGVFVFNVARADVPLLGGTLVPSPTGLAIIPITTDASGCARLIMTLPPGLPASIDTFFQCWLIDATASFSVEASNGLQGRTR